MKITPPTLWIMIPLFFKSYKKIVEGNWRKIPFHSVIVKTHLKKWSWSFFSCLSASYTERGVKLPFQVLRLNSIHDRQVCLWCHWIQEMRKSCHKLEFLNEQIKLHCTFFSVFSILLFLMSKAQKIWRWQIHSAINCCFNCFLFKMFQ